MVQVQTVYRTGRFFTVLEMLCFIIIYYVHVYGVPCMFLFLFLCVF